MPAQKVLSYYPTEIQIDDLEVGIHVARLDLDQIEKFKADYRRLSDPPSNRLIFVRRDTPDEQEHENGEFKFPLAAIAERRLREMTPEQRAEYDRLDAEDEAFGKRFLVESVTGYITVPEGQLEEEDGTPITTGRQLLRLYAGRSDVCQQLIIAIWAENTLTASEKKQQKSQFTSRRSSSRPSPEVPGPTPAPAASDAASVVSAASEGATASPNPTPSGSADDAIVH